MPSISTGARVRGLVMYLAGPGKANEHTNPHVVAASSREVFAAGGAGAKMSRDHASALAGAVDEARVVFGTEVTRRDTKRLKAAMERGVRGSAAIAEATKDENVWHCSLSMPPEAAALDDATWSHIVHDFMTGMGFDVEGAAASRWVAIRHGVTANGGDHVHIAASRVRDDGSVVALWLPHPSRKGNEGDYPRAQRVARDLEQKYGLEVLSSYNHRMTSRGRPHAQDAATKPERDAQRRVVREPRITEAPSVTLARRVRTAAAAAETEAEFVRLLRADGLMARSARYDRADPDAVTGFSVGLPAAEWSNRHGQPIFHGGKRLGEDLSLPRLRERWIDDDKSRADARAAWDHADASCPTRTSTGPDPTGAPRRGGTGASSTAAPSVDAAAAAQAAARKERETEAARRLRDILRPIARAASTEADYARELRMHPLLMARPRYAPGTTDVVGYSVALRPHVLAYDDGGPIWRNASYLGDGLALKDLRARWPSSPTHQQLAADAWKRATRSAGSSRTAGPRHGQAATADATQWAATTSRLDGHSRAWHTTAADTAAAVGAAAHGMSEADARALNGLADALAGAAGHQRSTLARGAHPYNSARRVAATMLAAAREDTTLLWIAVMAQVKAASNAVAEAMAVQGQARHAAAISSALAGVEHQFAGRTPPPPASKPARVPRTPGPTVARPATHDRRDDGRDFGR